MGARGKSTCPVCKRDVAVATNGRFYPHVPYDLRANTGQFTAGRRCLGSSKTLETAKAVLAPGGRT